MYTQFASVYDRLMGDFDYAAWAQFYLSMLSDAGLAPKTVCECACGTGSMAVELAKLGLAVTGVDNSPQMLERAQQKARAAGLQVPFVCQDMRGLSLHRAVDAIICPCDGVNYLLTDQDLDAFFRAARQCLVPGGALAFDVSSWDKLRGQAEARFFGEDLPDLTYLWQNRWHEKSQTVQMELCFFLKRPDGLYTRFDERQTQRAHQLDALTDALLRAGFTDIVCFGDRVLRPPKSGEARLHIVARNTNPRRTS